MIPNKWGLIRHPEQNLFALMFRLNDLNLSEYYVEEIEMTYTKNTQYVQSGARADKEGVDSGIGNISAYDYVLLPISDYTPYSRSGLKTTTDGGFNAFISAGHSHYQGLINTISQYALVHILGEIYACVTTVSDFRPPVLGLRRHRSDEVNPRNLRTTHEVTEEQDAAAEPEEPAEQKKRK